MLVPPAQPWFPTVALLLVGALAVVNSGIPLVGRWFRPTVGTRRRTGSQWIKLTLPFGAAVALLPVALALLAAPELALYPSGAIVLSFIAFGMQNAWDAVLRRDLRVVDPAPSGVASDDGPGGP
jgi:hypothetical protein